MTIELTTSNVAVIGKGYRYAEEMAVAVIDATNETYDWSARGAIPQAIRGALNVTAETEPRQKQGPKGDQRTTDYGRGFDTLCKAVKRALSADADKPATDWLALVRQAATNARNKGEFSPQDVLKAALEGMSIEDMSSLEQTLNAA